MKKLRLGCSLPSDYSVGSCLIKEEYPIQCSFRMTFSQVVKDLQLGKMEAT